MKYIHKPVANSISFVKTKSDFSLSVCSLPYYSYRYQKSIINPLYYRFFLESNYQLRNSSFWEKWRNVSTMIDSMTMDNGTDEIDLISADYANNKYTHILPYNNVSLAICHTFELSQYSTIHRINLVYNSEIEIYVHKNGQFLYEWNRKKTKILPSSKENVRSNNNLVEIFDTAFMLNMEIISSLNRSITTESFDDCLKAEVQRHLGPEQIHCYFDVKFSNRCLSLMNSESLKKIATVLNNQSTCNSPETVMSIETSQSNYLEISSIKYEGDGVNDDLGLTNTDAHVSLIFPSFTKISKVRYATIKLIINEYYDPNHIYQC